LLSNLESYPELIKNVQNNVKRLTEIETRQIKITYKFVNSNIENQEIYFEDLDISFCIENYKIQRIFSDHHDFKHRNYNAVLNNLDDKVDLEHFKTELKNLLLHKCIPCVLCIRTNHESIIMIAYFQNYQKSII